jgi:3-(3-hydroxy-phenyl)propionate hydroxylase
MTPDYDIAILGLGPVGSAAAVLLARAGLKVIAFDRDKEVYLLPRAVNMDGEIIRGFQALGLGDELNAMMQRLREGEWVGFVNSRREVIFGFEPSAGGVNGWDTNAFFDQPDIDGWLRNRAAAEADVDMRTGYEVSAFSEVEEGVELQTTNLDTNQRESFSAQYLLGCDGASSLVRRSLGISWQSLGYDQDWLVVDIELKSGHTLGPRTMQVCDPDRLATYVATRDPYRRWEFRLNDGEDPEAFCAEANVRELIEQWTPPGTYSLRRSALYTFHAAVAGSWRAGRVLLAGDAAHQTPPFLGQGMNAGMRDVLNLAWKFKLIKQGKATEALLDSYQAERDAHARDLVDWAVNIGKLMEFFAATEQAERDGTPPPPPMDQSSGYGQGRTVPPLRDGVICHQQVGLERPCGFLFSQPDVLTSAGERVRLDDLLGNGFAVVHRGQVPAIDDISTELLAATGGRLVGIDELEVVRGQWDRLLDEHDAVVVRPDRYVYGFTTEQISVNDLLHDAAQQMSLIPANRS